MILIVLALVIGILLTIAGGLWWFIYLFSRSLVGVAFMEVEEESESDENARKLRKNFRIAR